jgi:PAS domain S-box-containing protein
MIDKNKPGHGFEAGKGLTIRARILIIFLILLFAAVGGYYVLARLFVAENIIMLTNLSATWIALSMFVSAVVIYRALGERVIHRLSDLNNQTQRIRNNGNSVKRVHITGDDEIANLAATLNDTFDRLEIARKEVERAVEEWKTTFDSISDPISIQDKNFRILRANKAYQNLFDKNPDDILGHRCFEINHPEGTPPADCPQAKTLESGLPEYRIARNNGFKKPFETFTFPILNEKQEVTAIVHMLKDITERQAAEQEQKQLRDKAEVNSRLAAVGEMAAGIAHEINNPLTGVIGFSDLLMHRPDVPDIIREELKIINEGSLRVKDIIQRMLAFSQQLKPMQTMVNITELIDNTLTLRSYALKTANIKVIREYEPDLPWVTVDPGQIQQVFLNLIVNAEFAIKKARNGGVITITTGRNEAHIRILVSDNGPGMTEEARTKLFQPFFTTKNPGEGAGLGLSLSRGIIQEHGGTIDVLETTEEGTTFIIELPVTSNTPESTTPPETSADTGDAIEGANILIVDDESLVRSYIRQILTESGHSVDECDNGFQALDKLDTSTYDIVLMDIRMPEMSGIELHHEVCFRWPHLRSRITFITGDISDTATRDYLNSHKLPFLTKPFTKESLADRLNIVIKSNE